MKRRLSTEEKTLWQRITADVRSIKSAPTPETDNTRHAIKKSVLTPKQPQAIGAKRRRLEPVSNTDLFHAGDPRPIKHIRRGRHAIDATLDLHGQTQAQAHQSVETFILRAINHDFQRLLIITGKGGRSSNRTAPSTGVLQKALPYWLNQPTLNKHIARIEQAHQRHGGSGAYYVVLKSNR